MTIKVGNEEWVMVKKMPTENRERGQKKKRYSVDYENGDK